MTLMSEGVRKVAMICLLGLAGCVETKVTRVEEYSEELPAAVGAPASFVIDGTRTGAGTRDVGECPTYLLDRMNDVRLRLSESRRTSRRRGDTTFVRGYGDYLVEPGQSYGIGVDQLLRVDCARHAPVGVVTSMDP